ncbi:hypothetical protein ACFQ0P_07720 [Microbacterium insulae]|uniref:Glycosyl hydrolases family 39 N-terminal catalytic domain-containing protein n=1 Tax=Microbacterium insulae TaxID=483014 RepID=A0ABW3AHN3_9MICO
MKPVSTSATIAVDFSRLADHPLSHDRIALFNSGLVTLPTYRRDADYFRRAHPEHLRIDLGWGAEWMPWTRELISVDGDVVAYDFVETDAIAEFLDEVGVRPYWAYSYVPNAARPSGADWRTMDVDDTLWVQLVTEYVRGAAERGVAIGYHEVYNEPDLRDERTGEPVFYAGDFDDYLDLYRKTSRAIRAVDPTARVGGPALASVAKNAHWLRPFLRAVVEEDLPLDFLSFHHYGTYGIGPALQTVLDALAEFPHLAEVELHLNEYNSFVIDYPRGGLQDSHLLAAAFAADLDLLLGSPSLTRVSWAQFLDSGNDNYSGMIDIDGAAKPLYRVYEFYQSMPVDRRAVRVDGPDGVGAIASADDRSAAVLVWNRSIVDVDIRIDTGRSDLFVALLDSTGHDARRPLGAEPLRLERGAVALISTETPDVSTARRRVSRTRVHIEDRDTRAWSDVDETTATIRFGTADDANATVKVGLDLAADIAGEFRASVTADDGTPAAGEIDIVESVVAGTRTVWATLTGAAPHTFGRVDFVAEAAAEDGR